MRNYGAKYRIGDLVKFDIQEGEDTERKYDKIKSINVIVTDDDQAISYGMDLYQNKFIHEEDILEGPDHTPRPRKKKAKMPPLGNLDD